jgi:small subunit ribosomal protein S2
VIPANDDATKSIALVMEVLCNAIQEGLEERKLEKEKEAQEQPAPAEEAAPAKKLRPRRAAKVEVAEEAPQAE